MDRSQLFDGCELNLKATELRLGLPGSDESGNQSPSSPEITRNNNNKRTSPESAEDCASSTSTPGGSAIADRNSESRDCALPPAKAQIVGWPPIRSYRKNNMQEKKSSTDDHHRVEGGGGGGVLVKVSVDGAPYLRKIDLKVYNSYPELLRALEIMFKVRIGKYSEQEGYNGSHYAPTYEDKDSDWMLAGDVPWEMFVSSCKRLRIMKSSEAKGG
ncbi:Auxin-induced protein 22D [Dionaea muscipula]